MKFTSSTSSFRTALARLSVIPGAKGSPTAGIIKITTSMEGIEIIRRTPESRISITLDAEVAKEGEVVIDYDRAVQILSRFDGDDSKFERSKDGKWLKMDDEGTQGQVAIVPDGESYEFEEVECDGDKSAVDISALRKAIQIVEPAICRETARANLMGVFVCEMDGRSALVATNGRVCAIAYLPDTISGVGVMPHEAVAAILSSTKDESGIASIRIGTRRMELITASMSMGVQLLEDNFPKTVGAVFKRSEEADCISITVDKLKFVSAIKAAASAGRGDLSQIEITAKGEKMQVVGDNGADAKIRRQVECECSDEADLLASAPLLLPIVESIAENPAVVRFYKDTNSIILATDSAKAVLSLMKSIKAPSEKAE